MTEYTGFQAIVRDIVIMTAQTFFDEVCKLAEEKMKRTGQLEGAHYAAMQQTLAQWKRDSGMELKKKLGVDTEQVLD